MKSLLFILFLIPAASSFAQTNTSIPDGHYRSPENTITRDSIQPIPKMKADQYITWLDSSLLSHKTQKGVAYKMPIDNMPCLVPDNNKTQQFWGVKPIPDNRMPNAFRRKK